MEVQSNGGAGMAIASMVLGILALVLSCCLPGINLLLALIGVILGGVSLAGHKGGRGMAIAGVVCSIITLIPTLIVLFAFGGSVMASL